MSNIVLINENQIEVKEYQGQRVVTFKDIDTVHQRPSGTARKRFNDNKHRFTEGRHFFKVSASEIRTRNIMDISDKATEDVTFITESGYLKLVKSFTDDLAWDIQDMLVDNYFKVQQETKQPMSLAEIIYAQAEFNLQMERKQLEQEKKLAHVEGRVDKMQEAYIISPEDDWREWSDKEIKKVALAEGGYQFIRDIRHKIYAELERRYGVNLSVRLKNLKKRWEEAGKSKTAIKNLNFLDVIAEDKKLIEGYITIVKEYSISII